MKNQVTLIILIFRHHLENTDERTIDWLRKTAVLSGKKKKTLAAVLEIEQWLEVPRRV